MSNNYQKRKSSEQLCCCEYVDIDGHRNHILTCCCNCQGVDEIFEHWITCRHVPPSLYSQSASTCSDRLRCPFPAGARTFNLKIILVILTPPLYFILSAINLFSLFASITLCSVFLYRLEPRMKSAHLLSLLATLYFIYGVEFGLVGYFDITYRENVVVYATLVSAVVSSLVAKCVQADEAKFYYSTWLHYSIIDLKIAANS